MLTTKIAIKNLIGNKSFAVFFTLNLAIGLIGYTLLDGFKTSFKESVESSSKEMTTADLQISARMLFSDDQINRATEAIGDYAADKTIVNFFYSMVAFETRSRLAEVKAIEKNFPLYGKMTLKEGIQISKLHDGLFAFIYPELFDQLGVKLGDYIKIGLNKFKVVGTIDNDAGNSWAGASVAPRIYISRNFIESTGLLQKGSSVWSQLLFKLKTDEFIDPAVDAAKSALKEKGIRVSGHLEASENSGRLIGYLNDYLGLVTLAAFFLAAIGATFLYRSYLSSKLSDTATLICLGVSPVRAFWVSLTEIVILSIIAATVSTIFSSALLPILPQLVGDFLPIDISASIGLKSIISSFILALLGSISVCYPLISSSLNIKPAILFQEARHDTIKLTPKDRLYFLPGFFLFWVIACWQATSIVIGSIFFALFIGGGLILYGIGSLVFSSLGKIASRFSFSTRNAFLYLSRQKFASITCFLALSLGSMLTSLIPSVRESLYSEIENPDGKTTPSLFLFDIQEDQVEGLKKVLKNSNVTSSLLSPMITAELKFVNGIEYKKKEKSDTYETREEERTRRFTNRTMNLTYRDQPDNSEKIIKGKFWSSAYDQTSNALPEISIEQRFASRLGLNMGDELEFSVLGVPVKGKITSIRKIRWTTFQPNFFLQFQPGVMENAPKTYVGAINKIDDSKLKAQLQSKIVEKFPNVSIIDVSRLVQKISEIINKMSWALSFMAFLCLFAGLIVLYSICKQQINSRIWDISMLKVLGANFKDIRMSITKEFLMIALAASALGSSSSAVASLIMSKFIFEGVFAYNILIPISITASVTTLAVVVARQTSQKVLKIKPSMMLKN